MDDYAWIPTPERTERANVTRLMRLMGVEDIDALRAASVADVGHFWDVVVKDIDLRFAKPYSAVLDVSRGPRWATWFTDGQLNVADACVDRWREDPERKDQLAVIAEEEPGDVRTLTYAELASEVDALAAGLRRGGIGEGDVVAVYLPMMAEAVIAAYAIAKVGAIWLPLFSGFAPNAIASRLNAADAKLVITTDWSWRRGKRTPMKATLDAGVAQSPTVTTVLVAERAGETGPRGPLDVVWSDYAPPVSEPEPCAPTSAEAVLLLGYTSGTSGKPKGAVHTHAGFLLKVASELAYEFDTRKDDVFFWMTDMGWVMGPLSTFGTHALGAALLLYEGGPDVPDHGRLWDLAERHRITMLGVSPTLIRALKPHGDALPQARDLSSIQVFGSTGEPWDEASYLWLSEVVGKKAVPVINFSGGTEVGGAFLAPFIVEPIAACSLGGPSLGMDIDVFDADGNSVVGALGELVCKQPWPAMTRGLWQDPAKYDETYWEMYGDVWRHGDWAKVEDGQWFVLGRSDEAMNVAGKRVGPAEVEGILCGNDAVSEAAAVGIPDDKKGEVIWCFWTAAHAGGEDISPALAKAVGAELGKPFTPARVMLVSELPKTRSAKILRRAIRAAAIGADPGDLSGAENPDALDVIRDAVAVPV